MPARRSTHGAPASATTRAAHSPAPARRPGRPIRRLVPAREGAVPAAVVLRRRGGAEPAREGVAVPRAGVPARVVAPRRSRGVEWLVEFDLFVATNFLAPATAQPRSGDPGRARPGVPAVPRDRAAHRRAVASAGSRGAGIDAPAIIVPSRLGRGRPARGVSGRRRRSRTRRAPRRRRGRVRAGAAVRRRRACARASGIAETVRAVRRRDRAAQEPRSLVHAFARLDASDVSLVIAGGPVRWFPTGSRAAGGSDRAACRPAVQRAGDPHRLRRRRATRSRCCPGATVFAYPSLYEGFGFPVLEAIRGGDPRPDVERVVAARGRRRRRRPRRPDGRRRDRVRADGAARPTTICAPCSRPPASPAPRGSPGSRRRARRRTCCDAGRRGRRPAPVDSGLRPVTIPRSLDDDHGHAHPRHRRCRLHRLAPGRCAAGARRTDVTVLDRLSYGRQPGEPRGARRRRPVRVRPGRRRRCRDASAPLVASGRRRRARGRRIPRRSQHRRIRASSSRTNVLGTQSVLDACRERGTRMLMVSTDEVYGRASPDGGLFDEDAPTPPERARTRRARPPPTCSATPTWSPTASPSPIVRGTNAFGPRQIGEGRADLHARRARGPAAARLRRGQAAPRVPVRRRTGCAPRSRCWTPASRAASTTSAAASSWRTSSSRSGSARWPERRSR